MALSSSSKLMRFFGVGTLRLKGRRLGAPDKSYIDVNRQAPIVTEIYTDFTLFASSGESDVRVLLGNSSDTGDPFILLTRYSPEQIPP